MALEEHITILGLPGIQMKLDLLEANLFSKALMTEIGLFAMTRIKTRTLKGDDANGIMFKPYSDDYAAFRQEKGLPIDIVDLTLTGSMLSSMSLNADQKQVKLFFLNTKDPSGTSNPKKAFFLHQDREFFALSEEDVTDIKKMVERYYNRIIEG